MTDLEAVIHDLLSLDSRASRDHPGGWYRSATSMEPGVFRIEYPDGVFLMQVRQIPVRRLGPDAPVLIGTLDGLDAQLTHVDVDTHVSIGLGIAASPLRQRLLAQYEQEFQVWSESSGATAPPPQPAERLFRIEVELHDDLGTPYSGIGLSGYAGGTGREWTGGRRFLPVPPPDARLLTVRVTVDGADPVDVELPL